MLMVAMPSASGMSAPQIDIGTLTRMISGSRRLSYWAARTR
ncbi:Uncharacterised protein [Bordetella pertussis]|nr:Uncharacterised protein [Bordetella pertussis]CFU93698.1 Uncharacterised protein [Bordetella pertussis]CFV96383.1 Uncharacterised protein [Bordetella pertussis]CFW46103.1 Uncharacterised protein [Bordetella pertussis]CPL31685.1 Uncharacterised protein [Bordetella pertussis]